VAELLFVTPMASVVERIFWREMDQRLKSVDAEDRIYGIPLVDYDLYTPCFRETFGLALEILKKKDARRFQRVCRYIKGIVALPIGHPEAGYLEYLSVCAVRFRQPSSKDKVPNYAAWYASILVHEATHGRVHARGIPYDEPYRERIERLCYKEEDRFLKRLGLRPESLARWEKLKTFNSETYRRHWTSSFWQRWRQTRRYQKARKEQERKFRDGQA
jgi:hypothetical protein